eukprot:2925399-Pleurochrysis_carterae.AAC.1
MRRVESLQAPAHPHAPAAALGSHPKSAPQRSSPFLRPRTFARRPCEWGTADRKKEPNASSAALRALCDHAFAFSELVQRLSSLLSSSSRKLGLFSARASSQVYSLRRRIREFATWRHAHDTVRARRSTQTCAGKVSTNALALSLLSNTHTHTNTHAQTTAKGSARRDSSSV